MKCTKSGGVGLISGRGEGQQTMDSAPPKTNLKKGKGRKEKSMEGERKRYTLADTHRDSQM
jgi:hypothetical protein